MFRGLTFLGHSVVALKDRGSSDGAYLCYMLCAIRYPK